MNTTTSQYYPVLPRVSEIKTANASANAVNNVLTVRILRRKMNDLRTVTTRSFNEDIDDAKVTNFSISRVEGAETFTAARFDE